MEFTNPTNGSWWIVQIQAVRPSRRDHETELISRMRLAAYVAEAGSEQATNFRWWD